MIDANLQSIKEFYDTIAEDYDKEYDSPFMRLYNALTWSNLKRFLPTKKGALVLDAGGGTGYWALKLARCGYHVVLTEVSETMLAVAQRKIERENLQSSITTKLVDIRDMSCFPSDYFDLVMAQGDPVSYCLDAATAVRELARTVKRQGPVLISVDNKYASIPRFLKEQAFDDLTTFLRDGILLNKASPGALVGSFRFQAFTPDELRALFSSCGLQVVRLLGKPILTHLLPQDCSASLLNTHFEKVLNLELQLCDKPSLVGLGGHIEVVGLKTK